MSIDFKMRGKDSGKVVDEGVLKWSVDIRNDEAINDDDEVWGLVEMDLESCQTVIQCEAPGLRPVHHCATLFIANRASRDVNKYTATKSSRYCAGTLEK
ncbi:hypothetical protein DPMN_080372 [Dreissena polymorpha]|uniref:Uncharacterized protein n=1 Tax=Dreissena polymorpha TaxID=45954 RepID=A0A9D4BQW5_DREPO|nr:hypothetical protein DPMN_080372 [Dreissena polymorpha]